MINTLSNAFIKEAKDLNDKEAFLNAIEKQESIIFADFQKQSNSKLLPQLQKSATNLQQTPQPTFLNTSLSAQEKQNQPFLKNISYMSSKTNFNKMMKADSANLNIEAQIQNGVKLSSFNIYDQNFLDMNANSKFYHPEKQTYGLQETALQFNSQSNAQLAIMERIAHYNVENPEQKNLYPRGILHNTLQIQPLPETFQDKNFNVKSTINQLGGYHDTVQPMKQSLQVNEQRFFRTTPELSFISISKQEREKQASLPPPPEPEVIHDPFNRNPQYQMRNLNTNFTGPSFDVSSYLPTNIKQNSGLLQQQSNIEPQPLISYIQPQQTIQQIPPQSQKSSFLETQKRLRQQYQFKI